MAIGLEFVYCRTMLQYKRKSRNQEVIKYITSALTQCVDAILYQSCYVFCFVLINNRLHSNYDSPRLITAETVCISHSLSQLEQFMRISILCHDSDVEGSIYVC